MALTKQIFLYSIDTSAMYFADEERIHQRLLKLYSIRKNIEALLIKIQNKRKVKSPIVYEAEELNIWKKEINKLIRQEKKDLTALLDSRLQDTRPRVLNKEVLKPKSVISLFESALTRALSIKTNELTESIMVLNVYFFQVFENLVKNGFVYNGEKYIFFTASAGQIRQKKAVFIKESDYKQIEKKIMCGLSIEEINQKGGINQNKFCSYVALASSATEPWDDFDIDRAIVVDDFETQVYGEVDYIDYETYEITRKKMKVPIPVMDGAGIMLDGPTRMVRLPFTKGLMLQFDFHSFIKEKCPDGDCVIYDIYGKPHKIIEENVRYILTKSQFKLHNFFSDFSVYQENFKKYGCEASYCNIEEDELPKSRINYQMLQTLLDMKDNEINSLIQQSVKEIEEIGGDFQTTMNLLGATKTNKNPSWFQQALMIYPELLRDRYCREILKQTKQSLVKQAKAGRLRVNGEYRFLAPDLYAFCEWLFLGVDEPKGLLNNGEVYCREYENNQELACLRSPHLYKEWAIKVNKRNEEIDRWFGNTKCIYTSAWDLISKLLQFD